MSVDERRSTEEQQTDGGEAVEAEATPENSDASIGDLLGRPETKVQLKFINVLYAMIGFGFGFLALLLENQLTGDGNGEAPMFDEFVIGVIAVVVFMFVIFVAPVIAAQVGVTIGNRIQQQKQATLTSGIGNWTGYVLMSVIAILFVNSAFGGEQAELFNLGDLLFPLLILAIAPAIVGGAVTYVYKSTA